MADTHVVLWLALDETKISKPARIAIEQARHNGEAIAISSISLWEITLAETKGRIDLKTSLETFLARVEEKFAILALTGRICALTKNLPDSYPRDPADKLIGATAIDQGMSLITADSEIRRANAVPTIW